MTASATDIVSHFQGIPYPERAGSNWGLHWDPTYWDVDEDTYINGVLMVIDFDYDIGSLLEIVEKSTGTVSYLVVMEFSGWDSKPDFEWYPNPVGTFYERTVSKYEVSRWAVDKIYGLYDSWYDRRKASIERNRNASVKQD